MSGAMGGTAIKNRDNAGVVTWSSGALTALDGAVLNTLAGATFDDETGVSQSPPFGLIQ